MMEEIILSRHAKTGESRKLKILADREVGEVGARADVLEETDDPLDQVRRLELGREAAHQ